MTDSHEENLREAFDALRRDDRASAPSFASLTSPAALETQRRRIRRRRIVIMAAIIIPAAFFLRPHAPNEPDFERFTALTGIDPGQVTWRAPSDFLLDLPGWDLLRRVPVLEIHSPALAPADSARPPDSNVTKRGSNS